MCCSNFLCLIQGSKDFQGISLNHMHTIPLNHMYPIPSGAEVTPYRKLEEREFKISLPKSGKKMVERKCLL